MIESTQFHFGGTSLLNFSFKELAVAKRGTGIPAHPSNEASGFSVQLLLKLTFQIL
jgi:hypothetical protein